MMARPRKNAAASRASLLPESAPLPEIPVREQPYPLPEGWKWVRLGSVVTLQRGVSFKKNDVRHSPQPNDCLIIRGGNIAEGRIDLDADNVYVDKSFVSPNQLIKKYDIVIVTSTGSKKVIGRAGISFQDYTNVAFGAFLTLARINDKFNKKYISLYFQTEIYRSRIRNLSKGVNINNVKSEYITEAELPLPPREEQERIVEHIESLFARLDEARQKAEAVRDSVALRRAAILHKAFTGELTAKWREEQRISKESWEEKDFAHIITNIEAGKNIRCEERPPHENEVGIIKVSAVTWGFFNEMESKTCPDASLYNENIQIKRGDFLFSRANTIQLVGNCVIVENITKKLMLSDKILRFSIDRCTLKNYLLFFSMSEQYRRQIENAASGNQDGMRNISQKKLLGLTIPLPTLPEQREIVRILDDLLGREQRIREAADAVVAHIERMKKAILARAFRGELGRADCPSRP